MTVFISYSRKDSAFVDRLSIDLLRRNVKVWRDEYKLSAGDSLTARIQGAIDRASTLCVVLSDNAIASQWVRKEIDAGLLRVEKDHDLTIVPLLIEALQIPEALSDRFWIDFTGSYEDGLRKLLGVLERIASRGRGGQTEHGAYYHFWDIEGGYVGGRYDLSLEAVSLDREERFCIVTRLQLRGDEATTAEGLKARGIESPKHALLGALAAEFAANPARVNVRAGKPARARFPMSCDDGALTFEGTVEVRMIGATEGVTTLFNVGALIEQINAGLHA